MSLSEPNTKSISLSLMIKSAPGLGIIFSGIIDLIAIIVILYLFLISNSDKLFP